MTQRKLTTKRYTVPLLLALMPLALLVLVPLWLPPAPAAPDGVPTAVVVKQPTRVAAIAPLLPTTTQTSIVAQSVTSVPLPDASPTLPPSPSPAPSATATSYPTLAPSATPRQLPSVVATQPVPEGSPTAVADAEVAAPVDPASFIPILMYHYVREVDAAIDPLGYNLSVTPAQFADQLAWLADQGYTTVLMQSVARCLAGTEICPARAVALTFDDGYADAYSTALPLLQQHGFVATFYIVSDFVGRPNYMDWDQLRDLRDAGMELGAHSVSHPDLTLLESADATMQLVASKQVLEDALSINVVSFCYPSGHYDERIIALTEAAGYLSATTTEQQFFQGDRYALPRLRIYGGMSQASFAATMQSAP